MDFDIHTLVDTLVSKGGSDIHLSVNSLPVLRIKRRLIPQEEYEVLAKETIDSFLSNIVNEDHIEKMYQGIDYDFAHTFETKQGQYRFRINIYLAQGNPCVVMRYLPSKIKTLEQLKLPPVIYQFSHLLQGLVLVTGPTGSGKSTTLAAVINEINHTKETKIVTIEDPIEFIYDPHKSIVSQREVGSDTQTFTQALSGAFREDIDVILLGEMRDAETIKTAVTAAETGHLVFATLHTNSAPQSIDRIIDSFPPAQQSQVRSQLSNVLEGIVSQRLIPTVDGGLMPAVEILLVNNAVKNLIRENRIHQVESVIETNLQKGMLTMNHSLFQLIAHGNVNYQTAVMYSSDPTGLKNLVKRSKSSKKSK